MTKFSVMLGGAEPIRAYAEYAKRIEGLGFDQLLVADDLPMRPAWPVLTLVACATSAIELGPAIVSPLIAHPIYHASNLLTLDELSGGRAVGGIGLGAFNAMVALPKPARPVRLLREAYELTKRVIVGDTTPFSGEYFNAPGGFDFAFPRHRQDIPLFIGTWAPQMAKMAGRVAGGIMAACAWNPAWMSHLREQVVAGARSAGRDPSTLEVCVSPVCSIAPDADAARARIRPMLSMLLPLLSPMKEAVGIPEEEVSGVAAAVARGDVATAASRISERTIRAFTLTGTPREVIPQIEAIVEAGANHVNFAGLTGAGFDAIDLVGREILPKFR